MNCNWGVQFGHQPHGVYVIGAGVNGTLRMNNDNLNFLLQINPGATITLERVIGNTINIGFAIWGGGNLHMNGIYLNGVGGQAPRLQGLPIIQCNHDFIADVD